MSTIKKWSKKELQIAYYIAKWDMNGLAIEVEDLMAGVIVGTTKSSLTRQVANFRYILDIPGYQLKNGSKAMAKIVEEFKDTTMTNVRKIVLKTIADAGVKVEIVKRNRINNKISNNTQLMNDRLQENFEANLRMAGMFRRLKPVKK